MPSRSFTADAYSAWLSRWNVRVPGSGFFSQASSSVDSSSRTTSSSTEASGRRTPAGGIIPARSFRIIRSATSAFSGLLATLAASKVSRTRSPLRRVSL